VDMSNGSAIVLLVLAGVYVVLAVTGKVPGG
jgi:hypothetical protein